jgi:hypothetical protein
MGSQDGSFGWIGIANLPSSAGTLRPAGVGLYVSLTPSFPTG